MAADATGAYVVGRTATTPPGQTIPTIETFLQRYNSEGSVQWERRFSSEGGVIPNGIVVDSSGVYIAGATGSALPDQTFSGAADAFVRKYAFNGSELWTRQFGTTAADTSFALFADSSGVYVVGSTDGVLAGQTGSAGGTDAFVRRYTPNGFELWTRQFGSSGTDAAGGVAADATGIYVGGGTDGIMPGATSAGGPDAFVRKYGFEGNIEWTRQFGTTQTERAGPVARDATGVYIVGVTAGAFPEQTSSGGGDAFVRHYDPAGNGAWTHQLGSPGGDSATAVATDATSVYVAGDTTGTLPGQFSAGGIDSFLLKLLPPPPVPVVNEGGVVNNASFAPSPAPVAPGSIAAVFGSNLNDGSEVLASSFGPDGKLVTSLGGSSVTINDIPAPLFYSTPGQLGIQIPAELAGQTTATIQVTVNDQTSIPRTIFLDSLAPGIFTVNEQGSGPAAVLHEDNVTAVTEQNPARPGEVVVLFATGLGTLNPPLATGDPSTGNQTVQAPTVLIDGVPGEVLFSGAAPGFVGLNQINVRIPASTRLASNLPVVVSIGGVTSNTTTIAVQ